MTGKLEKAITVGRDLTLFVFGLAGIAYQQVTGNVNFVLLAIFTAMTGVPGLVNLIALSRGLRIESESSSQASQEPQSELDSS